MLLISVHFFPLLPENDTFVVWEMFPEKAGALAESGEEEDFYFSDSDWNIIWSKKNLIVHVK